VVLGQAAGTCIVLGEMVDTTRVVRRGSGSSGGDDGEGKESEFWVGCLRRGFC
jgi:hypothetical protein